MKLWSGRIDAASHAALDAINKSIAFDIRLWPYDVRGSRAHAAMLAEVGLISAEEGAAIEDALGTVEAELAAGTFALQDSDEDIHTAVERRVTELCGEAGKKLHTGRSRNDQVATDLRLFALDAIEALQADLVELVSALAVQAERHVATVLPAYTHVQRGQPVLLAHHLLAYVEMFRRDYERLGDAARRTAVSPLGSGACAGTSLPIDRQSSAKALEFEEISRNSLDAVSDRDFALELLADLAIIAVHLSRLGEELVLWCSAEFGFATPSDAVSTGSSMMPQKKNPDGAELMRGKAGRVFGDLMALLSALKGLPLSYNKDLQEDKEPLFDAVDTVRLGLAMGRAMIEGVTYHPDRMRAALSADVLATDLAEMLVRRGIPLRTAHAQVAAAVRQAARLGRPLTSLTADELSIAPLIPAELLATLSIDSSIAAKDILGGTAPGRVADALAEAGSWMNRARDTCT